MKIANHIVKKILNHALSLFIISYERVKDKRQLVIRGLLTWLD